jgi:hypothetical protein
MQTEQRTETLTYWTCHEAEHAHTTRESALLCIEKHEQKVQRKIKADARAYQNTQMIDDYRAGVEIGIIAARLGVKEKRASILIERALKFEDSRRKLAKLNSQAFEVGDVVNVVSYPHADKFEIIEVKDADVIAVMNGQEYTIPKHRICRLLCG